MHHKYIPMEKDIIIGREREMSELQRSMESDRSEFIIVYGRRRVGKTYLVDNFFNYEYDFSFVGGHRLTKQKQLKNFAKAMKKYAHLQQLPKYASWDDAFDALEELMESCPDNVLLLQFLAESNVIQCVTVTLSSKESEAANLLNGADTTHRLWCRSLLNDLGSDCLVGC